MSEGVTIEFISQPQPGLFINTIQEPQGTLPMIMIGNQVNSKYIVFGIALGGENNPYNFMVIQQ
jgi:hypothetical protein